MAAEVLGSIVSLMSVFDTFTAASWTAWRAVLRAAHALPLDEAERTLVQSLTGRQTLPATAVRELWLVVGRRAGKSIIGALLAVWAVCCRSYVLAPGEVGVFMVIASDRRQARVVKRYIAGLLRAVGALAELIERETADAIWLTSGLCIEIHTCSFRSLRGYTCVGAVVDEVAFWQADDSSNPDHEVLVALRAAMASIPEAMLVALTTPYARRGEAWRMYDKHFGHDDAAAVLVVNASTATMNPTIDAAVIQAAYDEDPTAAAAEFGGQFRSDVESFISVEALDAVTIAGRVELPARLDVDHVAFVDPAGGSGTDSMTLAVAHAEFQEGRTVAVLDCVREVRPGFSPASVVADFVAVLKAYRVGRVTGDRYAGEWPREPFRAAGIEYVVSERTKSEIYRDALPLLNSAGVELLDQTRLRGQLAGLERRTARSGKDSIDHGPNGHDDVSNSACGALLGAADARAFGFGSVPLEFWG